jgi:hypothetical protein
VGRCLDPAQRAEPDGPARLRLPVVAAARRDSGRVPGRGHLRAVRLHQSACRGGDRRQRSRPGLQGPDTFVRQGAS